MREQRDIGKLDRYFQEYQQTGKVNSNVHPWVKESWKRSKVEKVSSGEPKNQHQLTPLEQEQRKQFHQGIIRHVKGLVSAAHIYLGKKKIKVLLTDEEGYILETFEEPYLTSGNLFEKGQKISEEDIGTTSLPIAYLHQTSFILFASELWQGWQKSGWMGTCPILLEGMVRYGISFASDQEEEENFEIVTTLLNLFRASVEEYVKTYEELVANQTILDSVPLAIYRIRPDSKLLYANRLGTQRISGISPQDSKPKLNELITNYDRTPIAKAAQGIPTYNKEANWHTLRKSYNDITTAVPIERNGEVEEIITVTMPIEDLRTLVAHAAGFSAKYTLDSLFGEALNFTQMKEKAAKVALLRTPILLLGESGTGKQRLAHGIHQASTRSEGPYISIKFGDSPLELLEMELFGRVDADGDSHPGKFELADGGTLFLNTLEKMPIALGLKMLQAVSQGIIYRMGETTPRNVNVRMIASSDVELKRLVDRGEFSSNLYHWLSKSVIRVPSLNSRKEDIALLAGHIIEELAQQNNLPIKELSPSAVEVLKSYDWPRNIKQLQFVVEQAFFRTSSLVLEAKDILLPGSDEGSSSWKEDRDTFLRLWSEAGGNVSRLANMLRVSRVTLYRYMKKHGVLKE